jgi:hypothetical protein
MEQLFDAVLLLVHSLPMFNIQFYPICNFLGWRIQERSGLEMYTAPCATVSLLPRWRATSSRRVGFGRYSPSTTPTTPRTSPFPNLRGPLVSVSSRSGRIRKLLPQLRVCVFRLVTMVRIWCTRSLGRLNLLDFLLRHNALVGGHPGSR